MATAGYAITIKLVGAPQATTGIAAINKSLAQLNLAGRTAIAGISPQAARASVGALGNVGLAAVGAGKLISQGIGGAVRQFVQLGAEIRGVVSGLGDLAPALGPLAGLATTAGIVRTVTNFAAAGGEIQRTSGALGLNTQQLQANRLAWRLAGLSAEQFDQAFSGVSESLVGAQAGRNPQAIGAARQFGLHTGLPALEFIKELANKIKQLNDLKVSVVTQGGLLEAFGISRESLSLFQRGGDAIADYVVQGQKLAAMDAEAAARGQALETALTGLGAAATKVGFDIADGLTGKGIVPAIEGMKNWLLELGKSPAAIQNLTNAVEGLVAVLGVLAATPILKFLIRNPLTAGAVAAIAGGVALKGVTPPEDAKKWQDEAHKNKAGEAPTEFPAWWNQLRNWVFGDHPVPSGPKEESATAAIPPPVAAETRDSAQRTVSLLEDIRDYLKSLWPFGGVPGGATVGWPGGRPATLHRHGEIGGGTPPPVSGDLSPTMRSVVAAIGGGETKGFADPYHTLAGGGQFSGNQYPAGWSTGAGRSQFIPSTWADEASRLQLHDFGPHSQDWATADYASLIYGKATGGRNFEADQASGHLDPRGRERLRQVWPGGFNEGYEERYQAATKAGIGAAPPSPITGAAVPAPSPVTGTAPPAPSPITGSRVPERLRNLPGSEDMNPGDTSANDSSHHVQVEFVNAPKGMRTNLATQAGDASFSLRTRYAMDSVW